VRAKIDILKNLACLAMYLRMPLLQFIRALSLQYFWSWSHQEVLHIRDAIQHRDLVSTKIHFVIN